MENKYFWSPGEKNPLVGHDVIVTAKIAHGSMKAGDRLIGVVAGVRAFNHGRAIVGRLLVEGANGRRFVNYPHSRKYVDVVDMGKSDIEVSQFYPKEKRRRKMQ